MVGVLVEAHRKDALIHIYLFAPWRNYGHCCGTGGAGFHVEGPEPERRQALGISREKCGDRVLSAGLESGVHQRARLLRERSEAIRKAERASVGSERG